MFELISKAFDIILYQPLFNALVVLYEYIPGHDFGIAVIVFTLAIKFLFYPLGMKGIAAQKQIQDIQPQIKEIQEKYKDDKAQQAKATMELYQKEKVNPLSGCLPLLLQLPILFALYRVFWKGLNEGQLHYLYSFIPAPSSLNYGFLGLIDLSKTFFITVNDQKGYYWPVLILAVIVGVAQYFQTKMASPAKSAPKQSDMAAAMQKQMLYFLPAFSVLILLNIPAAVALYWLTSTLFTIGQQYIIFNKKKI
ncbi:MAG: YidC/Oxa1 family membrane protein insertase [Candidatus Parcubacteria bacterium]|nr:YidC/Oxa1 family membrane protein insertase [Candidatus Parcubacteria bacterium]